MRNLNRLNLPSIIPHGIADVKKKSYMYIYIFFFSSLNRHFFSLFVGLKRREVRRQGG